ncbi:MAG: carbohydrate binding family 9 domain-containing protein [Betaproteobacteria bacterium]|nr:carbohydrate binding family 9 domain-containing protein [Betaproteobacteria bacterium]
MKIGAVGAVLLAILAGPAAAIEVLRLAPGDSITLDGDLSDAAWSRAKPHDEFFEVSPREKVAAGVRTEARFAYDAHALYAAIRAHDPDPGQIRAPFARRDNVFADQDMVVLFVDPLGTRKFAHFVRANPRGVIADGLYNEDTGNEDFSPDFEVEVATGRFEGGWTAEFRIPFSSLRYTDPPSAVWSILVFRNYPREQRFRIASSPLPRDSNCFLCLNLPLTGLDDLPSTRHLAVTPQLTVRGTRDRGPEGRSSDGEVVPGVDVKWRPRADIVVDATVNPDFSQVELDTPQLAGNTQFALFYNEKRPFFLEGADILQGPQNAIYTRTVTDPAWGARLTQRSEGLDYTVLTAKDDGGGLVLQPGPLGTGFIAQDRKSLATSGRLRWQAGGGTTVGLVATDRSYEGGGANRVFGPDVTWFPTNDHRLRAQYLESATTTAPDSLAKGPRVSDHAARADWSFSGKLWRQLLAVEDVGSGFRADNGFFGQNGYRTLYSETQRRFLDAGPFNEVSPYLNAEYKTDRDGKVIYQQNNLGVLFGLPRATNVYLEVRPNNLVAVREGGGLRKRDQYYLQVESNPSGWFSKLYSEVAFGDRVDVASNRIGKGVYAMLMANLRPHPRAELEYRIDNDFIDSREAVEGSKRILAQRAQQVLAIWHFTARDSVRTIWQANWVRRAPSLWEEAVSSRESSDTLSLVYGHRRGIGFTVYVGATMGRSLDADAGAKRRQGEVFVKGAWTFDVL